MKGVWCRVSFLLLFVCSVVVVFALFWGFVVGVQVCLWFFGLVWGFFFSWLVVFFLIPFSAIFPPRLFFVIVNDEY